MKCISLKDFSMLDKRLIGKIDRFLKKHFSFAFIDDMEIDFEKIYSKYRPSIQKATLLSIETLMVGAVEKAIIIKPTRGKWSLNSVLCLKHQDKYVDLDVHLKNRRVGPTAYFCFCQFIIYG